MTKYALISVSDKTGIESLAIALEELDYTILSTSNTAKYLKQYCQNVVMISDVTGFPEILDGRVKTLHPHIHAGILANRQEASHLQTLELHGIDCIDIVVVNLYPFMQVRATPEATHEQIIENIDIGGPCLIRAAAKNNSGVLVLTDPADYVHTIEHLRNRAMSDEWRMYLARKAFSLVSSYDAHIAEYFSSLLDKSGSPQQGLHLNCENQVHLRYGENPHQEAAFYPADNNGIEVIHGKELSYNNYLDIDAALRGIALYSQPTTIIIKHTNPCGIGSGDDLAAAYQRAFSTDTISPYGGIVVVNRMLDLVTARLINSIFTEIIIAPGYEDEVLDLLRKKEDRRLLCYRQDVTKLRPIPWELRSLTLGYLQQDWDEMSNLSTDWQVVTERKPSVAERQAMEFGWKAVAQIKCNAIALTNNTTVFGLGMGQTSRIDSTDIAVRKAQKFGHNLHGAICASDGFFPFRDSIEEVAKHGIKAIIQPGGSKGDEECITACNELGIAMVFTGKRHFRH